MSSITLNGQTYLEVPTSDWEPITKGKISIGPARPGDPEGLLIDSQGPSQEDMAVSKWERTEGDFQGARNPWKPGKKQVYQLQARFRNKKTGVVWEVTLRGRVRSYVVVKSEPISKSPSIA